MDNDTNSYTDLELHAEFDRLFPHGFAGPDVFQELAPAGWATSPLLAVFHPPVDQLYEEALVMHRNLAHLRRPDDHRVPSPEPTREGIAKEYREYPIEPEAEVRELVGQCLWDILSDSHEVVAMEDGRALDLGSFRYAGGVLADVANGQTGTTQYDYMHFYLGTSWVSQRADLTPVYRDDLPPPPPPWARLDLPLPAAVRGQLPPAQGSSGSKREPEWLSYSPSEALANEEEQKNRDQELSELRESLDEGYREAVKEALNAPPPATVRAYQAVYGHFPQGWPPEA